MSRYIDADELKRNHMFYHEADNRSYAEERDIDETPTVDAVPVVRCRDCRFFKPWDNGNYGKCKTGLSVIADMFCWCGIRADGERKDGERRTE